jgi:hypothetical protein
MNTRAKRNGVLLLLFCSAACYILLVPLRAGYLHVSFSRRGYQTNKNGQVSSIVVISNGGPHIIHAGAGTESHIGAHQVVYKLGELKTLIPGEQMTVSVEPSPPPRSRVVAYCEKVCSLDWRGRSRWLLDAHILKRGVVERIYPDDASK